MIPERYIRPQKIAFPRPPQSPSEEHGKTTPLWKSYLVALAFVLLCGLLMGFIQSNEAAFFERMTSFFTEAER